MSEQETPGGKTVIINPEPTTKEGFRLRALEIAQDLAKQRTETSGIQFTVDEITTSARKILFFIENGI
jgi:hypothetical protein